MGHVLRISIIRIYYIKVSSRLEMSFDRNRPFYKISFPSPFAFFWISSDGFIHGRQFQPIHQRSQNDGKRVGRDVKVLRAFLFDPPHHHHRTYVFE